MNLRIQTNYCRIGDLLRLNCCSIYIQCTLWQCGMLYIAAVHTKKLENDGILLVVLLWEWEIGKKSIQMT